MTRGERRIEYWSTWNHHAPVTITSHNVSRNSYTYVLRHIGSLSRAPVTLRQVCQTLSLIVKHDHPHKKSQSPSTQGYVSLLFSHMPSHFLPPHSRRKRHVCTPASQHARVLGSLQRPKISWPVQRSCGSFVPLHADYSASRNLFLLTFNSFIPRSLCPRKRIDQQSTTTSQGWASKFNRFPSSCGSVAVSFHHSSHGCIVSSHIIY